MLTLRLDRDGFGNAELFGEVAAERFAGEGAAWFNLDEIRAFGTEPIEVAHYRESEASLSGEFGPEHAASTILSLRAYPLDALGHFGLHGELGLGRGSTDNPGSVFRVAVELRTASQALADFARDIIDLADGRVSAIAIRSDTEQR